MTHRAGVAAFALLLCLGGCGRVGPPVRSRPEPAVAASAGEEAGENGESEEEKP